MAKFPETEWIEALVEKLNSDEHYARVARNWEGDMLFLIEQEGSLLTPLKFYLDLWHGKCRNGYKVEVSMTLKPAFTLQGPYGNYLRLLKGEVEPMQALLTRKLGVHGNMAVLMRNVPTVLDFVRCCREITDSYIEF